MKSKFACLCVSVFSALFIFHLGTCIAQEFTARTVGDFGNVTVMEVIGGYDATKPDGSVNSLPRQAISKEFLKLHKDEYDFLVVFSNFDFQMPDPEAKAFYHPIRNDVRGIGLELFDYSSFFGSEGMLQGMIDMGNIHSLNTDPLDPEFENTLSILSHEQMHRWGAYVKFRDPERRFSSALLGRDSSHWSFLLDSNGSVLYGNDWQDNGNGTFTSIGARKSYSPLDLYLSGFNDSSQVPQMLLVENSEIDPARLPEVGATISGSPLYVMIDDIIAAEGERIPDASISQKTFKTAFILITAPGTFASDTLPGIESIVDEWMERFSILTDGQGIVNVAPIPKENIPSNPGVTPPPFDPRTLPPSMDDGVRWLMNNQNSDGSWMDLPQTAERDTAEVVLVLKNFSVAEQGYSMGLQWLAVVNPENMDFLSRKIETFAHSGQDTSVLISELISRQNGDGGWGSSSNYMSNPLDTSFGLKALALTGYSESSVLTKAIGYLKAKQNPDGGWDSEDGESSIQATVNVLSSFTQYRDEYSLDSSMEAGIGWVIQRQNPDGGFGNSPSTIYDTASTVMALKELGASLETVNKGLGYILNLQSGDGSWNTSPYQTALAVGALWKAIADPDLSIKSEDIAFSPPSITTLPSVVQVNATIRNLGKTNVPSAKVALYNGVLSESKKIGEQLLSFPGESTVAANFSVLITDSETHVLYISIDPENLIKESNKSNNVAGKTLHTEPTYDFEVLSSGLSVSQNPVGISHDVTITSRIINKGTMNAYNVQVRYYIDEAGAPFDIGTSTVDIPANSTIGNQITWKTNKAGENLRVTVFVDPFNALPELSKENNKAFTFLTVNGSTEPNLTVSYQDIVITPSPARERGSANISALVKNEGFSSASNIEVNFYRGVPGQDGVLLGSRIIPSLNTGESQRVSIDWTNITESGERIIYVQVDRNNIIGEVREDDNSAFIVLQILSLPDLILSTNSIAFAPSAPKDGDMVSILVTVQNSGEQGASDIRVVASEGGTTIGSGVIPSLPGHSYGTVSFPYDTTGKSGSHQVTAMVDPDNAILEQSKDNNQATRTFGVQDSNLWLTEPYISPNGDGVKDSTQFFFRFPIPRTVRVVILNERGLGVRNFTGNDLSNTTGDSITWDGLDDDGMVVEDGQYQIEVLDEKGIRLGSLPVVVDNNRSPISDALGTKYLVNNNLTCMLPDIGWQWFPDETGILFYLSDPAPKVPEYPTGIYSMTPDGQDVLRPIPFEWSKGIDPVYDYYYGGYELFAHDIIVMSPNGEKVAFVLEKVERAGNFWDKWRQFLQLWIVDADGGGLRPLHDIQRPQWETIDDVIWSPDGEYITFNVNNYVDELWVAKADGTWKSKLDSADYIYGWWWWFNPHIYTRWSPNGRKLAYLIQDCNDCDTILRITDLSGNKMDILKVPYSPHLYWVNDGLIVLSYDTTGEIWLIDPNGSGDPRKVENYFYRSPYSWTDDVPLFSPDGKNSVFVEMKYDEVEFRMKLLVKMIDALGNVSSLYETAYVKITERGTDTGNISNLVWSYDGKKIAFVDMAYVQVDNCPEIDSHLSIEPHLVVIDASTKKKGVFRLVEFTCNNANVCDPTSPYPECNIEMNEWPYIPIHYLRMVSFLEDSIHVIIDDGYGYFVFNSYTGEGGNYLPIPGVEVSPLGKYLTYSQAPDPSSECYGRGEYDLWAMSSLLNLTADLRVRKEKSSVTLRGTAQDLHFEGYKLEYSDVKSPDDWNPISPASDVPVVNDVFTSWVPPHEGTFYVKLTVWDKAGNAVWDRKRVSWGLSSSVTNLYKSLEIFSPNGDGVKDTVELYFTVLEPLHLEFNVYDTANHLVRTFQKNYALPTTDFISWDGMDESGKIVPDGKYAIRVFEYEFFVEVDNTPPDIDLRLKPLAQDRDSLDVYTRLMGHAFDEKLKRWVIEYGEGDNPQYWYEYRKGGEALLKKDEEGNPILNPIENEIIETYQNARIGWLVGKKFRLTAEDFAGNRRTIVTDLLEEKILLYLWDEEYVEILEGIVPAHLARPGLHLLEGLDTIRLPMDELVLQLWDGREWTDEISLADLSPGWIDLEWDNSHLSLMGGYGVRIKAVDLAGQEYHSNILSTGSLFYLYPMCPPSEYPLLADNSLFEKLQSLALQVKSVEDLRYTEWTDFDAYYAKEKDCPTKSNNPANKDCIPEGVFLPDRFPATEPGMAYKLRMVGLGAGGTIHISNEANYPPDCPVTLTLKINYYKVDCGHLSGNAILSAEAKGLDEQRVPLSLAYYIQKEEGLQLIGQFDLVKEGWGSASIDTSQMAEGSYPVKAVLSYIDLAENVQREALALEPLSVDRVFPAARITYPGKSLMVCPVTVSDRKGSWFGINVEGIAEDNNQVRGYELYYGIGGDPTDWFPAYTRRGKEYVEITGKGAVKGQVGIWDVTNLKGTGYSLKLKVTDIVGNVSCHTTSFSLDNVVEIVSLVADKSLLSPNGDGVFEEVSLDFGIDEYARVDVRVFNLFEEEDGTYSLGSHLLKTIVSGLQHLGGVEHISWDGKDESGESVPDGLYGVAVFATDSCGNTSMRWVAVEVDNTPPTTFIRYPRPGDPLANIVEVVGSADDLNFESYTLEGGAGDAPDTWGFISSAAHPVKDDILGRWNTFGLNGRWTLRLTVTDAAGNKGTSTVAVDLGLRKNLIKELAAIPGLFSPNNDGKLDTARVNYEVTDACNLTIEVFDSGSSVRRSHSTATSSSGSYSYVWDGRDNSGLFVPDGVYRVKLTAALSSNPSVTQDESITVIVDSTPPLVDVKQPPNNSYLKGDVVIRGTVSDGNIQEYSITCTGESGSVFVEKGSQSREDYTFGVLRDLPEGSYLLRVKAKDLGENETEKNIVIVVDKTAPKVLLDGPKDGEYYGSGKDTVNITGAVVEKNLETYSLRYGIGENPGLWFDLLVGNEIPSSSQLLSWKVGRNDGVPDGLYTISLSAKDKAGLSGEARVRVIIDNMPPEAVIAFPGEGDYITAPLDIKGTAFDQNLEKYVLELSEGRCSAASKWTLVKSAGASLREGLLGPWPVLPPDGDYCIRLTAGDKVGNKTEARVNIKVDTHPPAAPVLSGTVENKVNARLVWIPGTEPDLRGYNLYRDGQKVNAAIIKEVSYLDQGLKEGVISYAATAVDLAGNESRLSNQVRLTIDLTGPDGKIRSPREGSRVSGLVDIKGIAYSADDFKQYRVYTGSGASPSAWSLIRTSPVPISYGSLVKWDTIGLSDGLYSIKLEAEDLSGNITTDQISVTVDNTPPGPPHFISATASGSDVVLIWIANTEADLSGYLIYRNDQIANATGIVIGDLKPYLIAGTTFVDKGLPDGKFNYYLTAMDQAGNVSDPSNHLEIVIDNRAPHAKIAEPPDKARFENKIPVRAECPDIDVASVQFQYKRADSSLWISLGGPVSLIPYVTSVDPAGLGLVYGEYHLRAIATDKGGLTDGSPEFITVTYTDVTPPAPPKGLKACTNGKNVSLTWTGNAETDLNGYNVYRKSGTSKTKVNVSIVKGTAYQDENVADGTFDYEVTASDTSGNESNPSESASAKVYGPMLFQPYTPAGESRIQIRGYRAEALSSVEIFDETESGIVSAGTAMPDASGYFVLENVNLSLGENKITARAKDSSGNISKDSDAVVVVYNEPPSAPTGLAASAEAHLVHLTWNANVESDMAGYNLYRNGERLNLPSPVTSGEITASYDDFVHSPSLAFDSDPATYWAASSGGSMFDVWWEIDLSTAELISQFVVHWGDEVDEFGNGNLYAGKDFQIQVWSGHAWITQASIFGNYERDNTFNFTPAYRTDKIRIYIFDTTDPNFSKEVRISEIEMKKENLIAQASYDDNVADDGIQTYRVTAVDYYGFESLPSDEIEVGVGDLAPPDPPENLTATPSGADITLNWDGSEEADLAGFNLYRRGHEGWVKINIALVKVSGFIDRNLSNGTYSYFATAVDGKGNESLPSNEVSASVYIEPPLPPINLRVIPIPEGRTLRASWEYEGGSAAGYNLYRSAQSGGPYLKVSGSYVSATSYLDTELTNGMTYYYVVTALDHLENESAHSNEVSGVPSDSVAPLRPEIIFPTLPGATISLSGDRTDIAGISEPGSIVGLFKNGIAVNTTTALDEDVIQDSTVDYTGSGASISADGKNLAYTHSGAIWMKNLGSGETTRITEEGTYGYYPLWSPDGRSLAYTFFDDKWNFRIGIHDIETGHSVPLTDDTEAAERNPSWTSDGAKIAFVSNRGGSQDTWIKDLVTGTLTRITSSGNVSHPILSPNGERLAYFDNNDLNVKDVLHGVISLVDEIADKGSLDWSQDGKRLAFLSRRGGRADVFVLDIESQNQMQITNSPEEKSDPKCSPDGRDLVYGRLEANGTYSLWIASLQVPGPSRFLSGGLNSLDYLSWARSGGIASIDTVQGMLRVAHLAGHFSFNDVSLDAGENLFFATAVDLSGNESLPSEEISIVSDGTLSPDLEVTNEDIVIHPACPMEGEEALIQAIVRNKGRREAWDVDVDVYLRDPTGKMNWMRSERIPYLAAHTEQPITIPFDTRGKTGTNEIILIVDPWEEIPELSETNNFAAREFSVVGEAGVFMETTLDASEYESNQDVMIGMKLRNSGFRKDVTVETRIEDPDGNTVSTLRTILANLPYGAEEDDFLAWNTGSTFAGFYRVRTVLREGAEIRVENIVPLTILPDIDIQTAVVTDKTNYGPWENAGININVTNGGHNYAFSELKTRIRILNSGDQEVLSEAKEIKTLLPGGTVGLATAWNTGLYPPGDYRVVVDISLDAQVVSSQSASFKIDPSLILSGSLTVTPTVVFMGNRGQVDYVIRNSGNVDGSGLPVRLLIVDPETRTSLEAYEETIDLSMSKTWSGTRIFSTEGYGPKTYGVSLQYVHQGSQKTIENASFTVKDGTPPVVVILSPASGGIFCGKVDLAASAVDSASGVDHMEYRIDSSSWKLLPVSDPSSGRCGATWTPAKADGGTHTLSFRAVDRAGNISTPVSTSVTIDLTPPEPPRVLSPKSNSTLTAGTVDINGSAEPGAVVKMEASTAFTTQADAVTGGFVFNGVSLVPGKNTFVLTAIDGCGNVSNPREYVLNLVNQYTITASAGSGGTVSPSGKVAVNDGESQTFTITPGEVYRILDVEVDGDSVGVVSYYTFSNVSSNHTINATFKQRQVVTLPFSDNFDNDTVGAESGPPWDSLAGGPAIVTDAEFHSGSKSIYVEGGPEGSRSAFVDLRDTYADRVGYEAWVKVNEASSGAFIGFFEPVSDRVPQFNAVYFSGDDRKVYFYSDDSNHRFLVPLLESYATGKWHKVRVEIDFTNLTGKVAIGDVVVGDGLKVSPKNATWEHEGTINTFLLSKVGVIHSTGGPVYFDDFTVFQLMYSIAAATGPGGTITPSGSVMVNHGEAQRFTILPGDGYHVVDVLVDGVSVGAVLSYVFSDVTANHTIESIFAINQYTITASTGANGRISPSGFVTINHGDSQTFTITPDEGYHVADVLIDGVSVGAVLSYTFNKVTSDHHTISASFAINQYRITATSGSGGSISPSGEVAVNHGASQPFSIIPAPCCHLVDVVVDGSSVGAVAVYTFTKVIANHTISASFAINTYTITAMAGANGTISPSGSVPVSYGGSQTFTITPNEGFHIADVKVDGASVGPVASYPFANVTSDHTIEVIFEVKPTIEMTKTIRDVTRVLVWLNYNWQSGKDCPDRSLIEKALGEAGVDYEIVLDRDHFGEEMRNPYYTDFMILGDHQSAEGEGEGFGEAVEAREGGGGIEPQCYLPRGHLLNELREQVYSGKGLIVSLLTSEFFENRFVGYLSKRDYPVELLRSEISNPGNFQSYGRAIRVIPLHPEGIVGWIAEMIKKVKVKYPAILKWQYGKGRLLFFAFDLGLSSTNYGPFSALLGNSLNYIHKPIDASQFLADQFVPVEMRLRSFGGAFDMTITETYPSEFGIYDHGGEKWITENPWVMNLSLGAEERMISYDLFTAGEAGLYTVRTEVGYMENGDYHSLQTLSTEISVAEDETTLPEAILTALKSLPVLWKDKMIVDRAAACIKNVQKRGGATIDDIEKNIADLLQATDWLLFVTSANIAEIRRQIDRLLRIWESRWYFWPGQ